MAWTNYQKALAVLMVVTGSINTIATKWADKLTSKNSKGVITEFNHPFLQACSMFLGELSCLLLFKIIVCSGKPSSLVGTEDGKIPTSGSFNPFIFLAPALCDLTATSTMYVGLNLTYASSFQMLRGAVIVFTGLLSVAFLDRHLKRYEWLGIFIVIIGLICVGLSDIINPDDSANYSQNSIITDFKYGKILFLYLGAYIQTFFYLGDLLIIMAQIIVATQMVIEEKFVSKYNVPPLQGVGWEGLFGFVTLSILLVPMYYIKVGNSIFKNPDGQMEDAIDGFIQIHNNWRVALAITGTVVSIAFFNFAGLSVTKEMSATTRMVLDSVRTFTVWIFSLSVSWQKFYWLQLVGFVILLIGMCLYNDVFIRPLYNKLRAKYGGSGETQPLLRNSDEESSSPLIKSGSTSINT